MAPELVRPSRISLVLTPIEGMTRLAGFATWPVALGSGTAAQWPRGIAGMPALLSLLTLGAGWPVCFAQTTPAVPAHRPSRPTAASAAASGLRCRFLPTSVAAAPGFGRGLPALLRRSGRTAVHAVRADDGGSAARRPFRRRPRRRVRSRATAAPWRRAVAAVPPRPVCTPPVAAWLPAASSRSSIVSLPGSSRMTRVWIVPAPSVMVEVADSLLPAACTVTVPGDTVL